MKTPKRTKISPYRGVYWHKDHRLWIAKTTGKPGPTGCDRFITLGYFDSPEDAAMAYDSAARLLRGPNARLNFPGGSPPPSHIWAKVFTTLRRRGFLSNSRLQVKIAP